MNTLSLCETHLEVCKDALIVNGAEPEKTIVYEEMLMPILMAMQQILYKTFLGILPFLHHPAEFDQINAAICPICHLNSYDFSKWVGESAKFLTE
jgi:hypothetical protein